MCSLLILYYASLQIIIFGLLLFFYFYSFLELIFFQLFNYNFSLFFFLSIFSPFILNAHNGNEWVNYNQILTIPSLPGNCLFKFESGSVVVWCGLCSRWAMRTSKNVNNVILVPFLSFEHVLHLALRFLLFADFEQVNANLVSFLQQF